MIIRVPRSCPQVRISFSVLERHFPASRQSSVASLRLDLLRTEPQREGPGDRGHIWQLSRLSTYPVSFVTDFLNELRLLCFSLAEDDPRDWKEVSLDSSLAALLVGLTSQSGCGLG